MKKLDLIFLGKSWTEIKVVKTFIIIKLLAITSAKSLPLSCKVDIIFILSAIIQNELCFLNLIAKEKIIQKLC